MGDIVNLMFMMCPQLHVSFRLDMRFKWLARKQSVDADTNAAAPMAGENGKEQVL